MSELELGENGIADENVNEDEKMESETYPQENTQAFDDQDEQSQDDEEDRKLFIGGLNWNTKEEDLKSYCEKSGEVTSCDLKLKPNGASRCFAFVVFKSIESAKKFLSETHNLDGKTIDPKFATRDEDATKIFVGGVSTEASEEEIRTYFEKFGKIKEMTLPVDGENKRRPFAFVVYEDRSSVKKATVDRMHTIHGKECEVKKSVNKPKNRGYGGYGSYGNRGYNYQAGGDAYQYGNYPNYGNYGSGGYGSYPYGSYDYYGQASYGWYDPSYAYGYNQQSSFGKSRGRGGRGFKPY